MTQSQERKLIELINHEPAMLDIVQRVARKTGVSETDIIGGDRTQPNFLARAWAMHEMRAQNFSYSAIGRFFARDHTSVMNACRRISKIISE